MMALDLATEETSEDCIEELLSFMVELLFCIEDLLACIVELLPCIVKLLELLSWTLLPWIKELLL